MTSLCINPVCRQPQNSNHTLFCQACGSELLLEGRYRATDQLGEGGFGKTFEVRDRNGGAGVLKVLTDNHPKAVELFQQEAQVLSRLDHPGIPRVEPDGYFIFLPRNSQEALHCLVMEKIEGSDLEEWFIQRGDRPIGERLALEWLTELMEILHQVHQQGIFHRDIKPSNIMLQSDGHLVLIDFGSVREVTGTYLQKLPGKQVTGIVSAGYTPPEQAHGQAMPQSDFFALGRTFVYLLTGKHPTDPAMYDAHSDTVHWRNHASQVSPQFAEFLDALMARSANQRPANTQVILQQLAQINQVLHPSQVRPILNQTIPATQPLGGFLPPTPPISPQQKSPPGRGFLLLWVSVTFVGLAFGGIVGGVLQWLILRKRIYGIGWWWILTTTIASGIVGGFTGIVATFASRASLGASSPLLVLVLTVFTVVSGALIGWMQYLVLRHQVDNAQSWILANVVGACLAGILPITFHTLGADSTSIWVVTFLIGMPIYGVVTGKAMMKLLRHPKQPNP